jgi:hypothetical protein
MTSTPTAEPDTRPAWQKARSLARRALLMEVWGYLSIARFVLRRPRVPHGAQAFTYHQPVFAVLVAFIVISAVELVVVDLVVRRWETVRIALLVLGVWGLVWMFGLLFGFLTRPHAVGPDGLRLRAGVEIDIPIRWDQVASVQRHKRISQTTQPQITRDEDGHRTLHLHVQNQTNVRVVMREPVTVRVPRGPVTVSSIELHADEPDALVQAARVRLTGVAPGPPTSGRRVAGRRA